MNYKLLCQHLHLPVYFIKSNLKNILSSTFPPCESTRANNVLVICKNDKARRKRGYYACITNGMTCGQSASFPTEKAMHAFLKKYDIHLEYSLDNNNPDIRIYKVRETFQDKGYFWSRFQVPSQAHRTKLLSNGSIVTGYWQRKGDVIFIYRPNPNSPVVYNPMSLKQQIKYRKTHSTL